jgi:hypothetical protein
MLEESEREVQMIDWLFEGNRYQHSLDPPFTVRAPQNGAGPTHTGLVRCRTGRARSSESVTATAAELRVGRILGPAARTRHHS